MKPKQILILAGIFAALLVGILIKNLQKPPEMVTEEYTPLNFSFKPDQILKIKIKKSPAKPAEEARADTSVELAKDNNQWRAATLFNARADHEKIEGLLAELQQVKGELRGKGKELFADFGIGEEGTFHVLLQDAAGFPVLDLVLGSQKAGRSVFIRQKESDEIYLAQSNLFSALGIYGEPEDEEPDSHYWAAMDFLRVDPSKVKSIEVRRFDGEAKILMAGLAKDPQENKWKYTQDPVPFPLDSQKTEQFLNALKAARAQKVLDPKAQDFSKPVWQMKLGLEDGGEVAAAAAALDSQANAYPVQVSTEPVVFQVAKYYFDNLSVDDSKFFADNPFKVEAGKIEQLVVQAGEKKLSFKPKEKKWQGLESYLNDLKNFKVERLIFETQAEGKKARPPARYAIEIQREGEPLQALEVGDLVSKGSKEYTALKRNINQPFAISESVFKQLFENLDRLTEPKTG